MKNSVFSSLRFGWSIVIFTFLLYFLSIGEFHAQECLEYKNLGVASARRVSDGYLWEEDRYSPAHSVIDGSSGAGAWVAGSGSSFLELIVSDNDPREIRGIVTQGRDKYCQWVSSYKIEYTSNGTSWSYLMDLTSNTAQIFTGNSDDSTKEEVIFPIPISAKRLRIIPVDFEGKKALRADILVCDTLDTDGDGIDDPNDDCPFTPNGHSIDVGGCSMTSTIDNSGIYELYHAGHACIESESGGNSNYSFQPTKLYVKSDIPIIGKVFNPSFLRYAKSSGKENLMYDNVDYSQVNMYTKSIVCTSVPISDEEDVVFFDPFFSDCSKNFGITSARKITVKKILAASIGKYICADDYTADIHIKAAICDANVEIPVYITDLFGKPNCQ